MKLLFDENLSKRLVEIVAEPFPESAHVSDLGLLSASDESVWARAGDDGFAIVTKDSDFHALSLILGAPPKVLWLRCGNLGTGAIGDLLLANADRVKAALNDPDATYFALYA